MVHGAVYPIVYNIWCEIVKAKILECKNGLKKL